MKFQVQNINTLLGQRMESLDCDFDNKRRRLIKMIAIGLSTIPFHTLTIRTASATGILSESDPMAVALRYKVDATQSSIRTDMQAFCKNCNLSSFPTGGQCPDYAPCSLFPGLLVAASGWCAAWIGKANTGNDTECSTVSPATTLIKHYYTSILRRDPEPDGLAFWQGLVAERQAQGMDVKPVFRNMAYFFFNSNEYLGRYTTDYEFITNLYLTFFQREPDEGGYAFWLEQLAKSMIRNDAMTGFLYSPEFTNFIESLGF